MANNEISFSLMKLVEETNDEFERFIKFPIECFKNLDTHYYYSLDNTFYEINIKKEPDYIWFSLDYGNPSPRDEHVTDIKTGDKIENKRKENEVELISQCFILFFYKTETLYLSNLKKISVFEKFVCETLKKKILIKKFYTDPETFIEKIKTIESIKFTDVRNLFNQESKERIALRDLTGTNAPEEFTIYAKYNKSDDIIKFIKKLLHLNRGFSRSELVIKGEDNDNFSFIFNEDTFLQKIDIKCLRNKNGKIDSNFALTKLLQKIDEK